VRRAPLPGYEGKGRAKKFSAEELSEEGRNAVLAKQIMADGRH